MDNTTQLLFSSIVTLIAVLITYLQTKKGTAKRYTNIYTHKLVEQQKTLIESQRKFYEDSILQQNQIHEQKVSNLIARYEANIDTLTIRMKNLETQNTELKHENKAQKCAYEDLKNKFETLKEVVINNQK